MARRPPGTIFERALALAGWTAVLAPTLAAAQDSSAPGRVLLRLAADSGAVGSYRFTSNETHTLSYDIAPDDPRAELLSASTGSRQTTTDIALTMVAGTQQSEQERRYLVYWLGFRVTGDSVQTLNALQWDSIFQKVGRRAVLTITPRGSPRGIEVGDEAARPVGRAFADILTAMALGLPSDSVAEGDSWTGEVALPVRQPDGTRVRAAIRVVYRFRGFEMGPEGLTARIEFDGEPTDVLGAGVHSITGAYFGEAFFAVREGRYERMLAAANLDVSWKPGGDLPPSRSQIDWQARFDRR